MAVNFNASISNNQPVLNSFHVEKPVTASQLYQDSSPLKSKTISVLNNRSLNNNTSPAIKGGVLKFNDEGKVAIFKLFEQIKNPEKIQRAMATGNVAQLERINGEDVFKVAPELKTRMKEAGINQVSVKNAAGELVIQPAKIKSLSDQELKNLYVAAKTQIVFLQTMKKAAKEEAKEDDALLKVAEFILKHASLELAVRKGSKEEISDALKALCTSFYDTSEKADSIYNAVLDARKKQKELEEEIEMQELKHEIVQGEVLDREISFQGLQQKIVKEETGDNKYKKPPTAKTWSHMNPLIDQREAIKDR